MSNSQNTRSVSSFRKRNPERTLAVSVRTRLTTICATVATAFLTATTVAFAPLNSRDRMLGRSGGIGFVDSDGSEALA